MYRSTPDFLRRAAAFAQSPRLTRHHAVDALLAAEAFAQTIGSPA